MKYTHPYVEPVVEELRKCAKYIESLEKTNTNLRKVNDKLKTDADSILIRELKQEIKSLEDKLKLSFGFFSSEKELEAFRKFESAHSHHKATFKIEAGQTPYIISQYCGIGITYTAVCPICGKKKDITDTSCW